MLFLSAPLIIREIYGVIASPIPAELDQTGNSILPPNYDWNPATMASWALAVAIRLG